MQQWKNAGVSVPHNTAGNSTLTSDTPQFTKTNDLIKQLFLLQIYPFTKTNWRRDAAKEKCVGVSVPQNTAGNSTLTSITLQFVKPNDPFKQLFLPKIYRFTKDCNFKYKKVKNK